MDLKSLKDTPPWDWPQDAGKKFLDTLRDDRAGETDRLLAAELAGDFTVIDEELVEALLSILQNRNAPAKLRGQAVISLGPVLEYADTEGFDDLSDVPISENTFHRIQESFHEIYTDAGAPKLVRRRILEASVRAPQDWHRAAIGAAYSSNDQGWKLTAVFSMGWIRGFDDQILEALNSENEEIRYHAVCAAGNWEIDSAWSHVVALVTSENTDKGLLLAAIDAVASIRPQEAGMILVDLIDCDDEDIVEAAHEAMALADAQFDEDFEEEEGEESLH